MSERRAGGGEPAVKVWPEVEEMLLRAEGEAGRAWLEALPRLVAEACERWSLRRGAPYPGGAVAYVAPAELADGTPAVLKVSIRTDETEHEGAALRHFAGEAAVRLLDEDVQRNALLLERAEPGHSLLEHPDRDEAIALACGVLRRLWRPLPAGHPFPLVRDLALRLAREIPEEHGRLGEPFERELADRAAATYTELARSEGEPVLANRDYHLGNVLAARREPWLAIDPKPLAGERAFDTGHLLRDLLPDEPSKEAAERLAARLAAELELDPQRVRAWAFVRSVENALWSLATFRDAGDDIAWSRHLAV